MVHLSLNLALATLVAFHHVSTSWSHRVIYYNISLSIPVLTSNVASGLHRSDFLIKALLLGKDAYLLNKQTESKLFTLS